LRDLYDEYTQLCEAFGNGVGSCNHQWAGYFYDGLWLIAQILDTYLVQQNNSLSNLGTLESRQALYNLSLAVDFYGQTGRVSQWRSATGTELDREGIVLLRQATGTPEKAFGELAYRTAEGFQFQTDILWTSDGSKKVLCQGKLCQLQSGWIPLDGVDQCHPGEVWPKELGCSKCDPGTFSSDGHGDCEPCPVGSYGKDAGMAQCVPCAPGTANPLTGMTACIPCLVGHFMNISGALLWQPLAKRIRCRERSAPLHFVSSRAHDQLRGRHGRRTLPLRRKSLRGKVRAVRKWHTLRAGLVCQLPGSRDLRRRPCGRLPQQRR